MVGVLKRLREPLPLGLVQVLVFILLCLPADLFSFITFLAVLDLCCGMWTFSSYGVRA